MANSKKTSSKVEIDQRRSDRRATSVRRQKTTEVASERRKDTRRKNVQRRRQIDPTTCERDYTDPEVEFMQALDEYKRKNGRMFPTCSEILEVVRDLGYVQTCPSADGEETASETLTAVASAVSLNDPAPEAPVSTA